MRYVKKILKIGVLIGILSLISIFGADRLVERTASDKVYNSTDEIPYNKVGLFLGTGKILSNGRINLY
jgi:SanA protein